MDIEAEADEIVDRLWTLGEELERAEPARLREIHGESFERYQRAVPSLLPLRGAWREAGSERWSFASALRNREHWMILALVVITWALMWRAY